MEQKGEREEKREDADISHEKQMNRGELGNNHLYLYNFKIKSTNICLKEQS